MESNECGEWCCTRSYHGSGAGAGEAVGAAIVGGCTARGVTGLDDDATGVSRAWASRRSRSVRRLRAMPSKCFRSLLVLGESQRLVVSKGSCRAPSLECHESHFALIGLVSIASAPACVR